MTQTQRPDRILLIRHGASAHSTGLSWVDAAGFQRWRDAYDEAGIGAGESPPQSLVAAVADADVIVASDLRRAIESAERLAASKAVATSALLREVPLAVPAGVPFRLPVNGWDALAHMLWGYRILRSTDASAEDLERATNAAVWLNTLAVDASTSAVVTHGVFRRLLAERLGRLGWRAPQGRRSYKCWSVWTLERQAPR